MTRPSTISHSGKDKLQELRVRYAAGLEATIAKIEQNLHACLFSDDGERPWIRLRSGLHDVAGSAAAFGFASLTRTARALEDLVVSIIGRGGTIIEDHRRQVLLLLETLKECAARPDDSSLELAARAAHPAAVGDRQAVRDVFLADAHDEQRSQLATDLTRIGYQVSQLSNRDELEAGITETRPAALVISIGLIDDLTMAILTRARRQQGPVPLVVLSPDGDLDSRLLAHRCGADAFVLRPVDIALLVETLDRLTTVEEPEPYRILIIDDSTALSSFYSVVLEQAGMTTAVVNDPVHAIETMNELHPDLVLMDLYMPRCSGHELAAVLRQLETHVSIPIVYLSGERDIEKQLRALRSGGDDFLTKPIRPEYLVSAVAAHAERGRALRSVLVRDGLTGLINHTRLKEMLTLEVARAARTATPLAFAIIDLDHFKAINRSLGHQAGDQVLRNLSRFLRRHLKHTEAGKRQVIGRYGGEELGAVLPDVTRSQAMQIMDKARSGFAELVHRPGSHELTVTFSCGIAAFPEHPDAASLNDAANTALQQAKAAGRNQVVVA